MSPIDPSVNAGLKTGMLFCTTHASQCCQRNAGLKTIDVQTKVRAAIRGHLPGFSPWAFPPTKAPNGGICATREHLISPIVHRIRVVDFFAKSRDYLGRGPDHTLEKWRVKSAFKRGTEFFCDKYL